MLNITNTLHRLLRKNTKRRVQKDSFIVFIPFVDGTDTQINRLTGWDGGEANIELKMYRYESGHFKPMKGSVYITLWNNGGLTVDTQQDMSNVPVELIDGGTENTSVAQTDEHTPLRGVSHVDLHL